MAYEYQGSMQEIMSRVEAYKRNPTLIQRAIIDYVEELSSGEITIVDVTNPFVLLLEASAINTTTAINHSDINLRRTYSSLAQTDDEIFRHLSDKEIINRFSTPSSVEFLFMIPYDEFLKNMVEVPNERHSKLTIPKDTFISVKGTIYTFSYAVDIKLFNTGIMNVSYVVNEPSPIETISTNNITPKLKTQADGTRILYFSLKLKQLEISSVEKTVEQKAIFKKTFAFKNRFFYARAFHKGNITDGKWAEINTTHTDQVYNVAKPTMCFKVLDNELEAYIPHVYITNGLIGSTVRIDIYTTEGESSIDYRDYTSDSFSLTFRAIDPVNDSIYSRAMDNVDIHVISVDVNTGGSNGISFSELRDITIDHANGENRIPITNVEVRTKLNSNGFDFVPNVDILTNRIFYATRKLPTPSNSKLLTPVNVAIATTIFDSEVYRHSPYVILNDKRTTIKPGNLYRNDNGIINLVPYKEVSELKSLDSIELVNNINANRYLFTPFYYVLDKTEDELDVRAYDLDNPTREEINFIFQNDTMQMPVNSGNIVFAKTDNGYELYIKTTSGEYYKQASDNDVGLQLGFYPNGEAHMAYINGELYSTNPNDNERIWKFSLYTNYDLDKNNCLAIVNGKMFVNEEVTTWMDLNTTLHLFHHTSSVTNIYREDNYNKLLGSFILPEGSKLITYETLDINIGSNLDNLWRRSRNIPVGQTYKRHEVDVPLVYETDIMATDETGLKVELVDGKIQYNYLHRKGDPVIINDEIVYKHKVGDIFLDVSGKPVPIDSVRIVSEVDVMYLDGALFFVTDSAFIKYKSQVTEIIKDWVMDDISANEDNLLEKTSLYFYPKTTLGKVDVYLSDRTEATIDAQQKLTVELYVSKAIFENQDVRELIKRTTISIIDKHIGEEEVDMEKISSELRANYDTGVITFRVHGLGGSINNYPIIRIKDSENRLCINKRAVSQTDGTIIIEDDIDVKFIRYNQN